MSTGAMLRRQLSWRLSVRQGQDVWAAWELVWTAWGPSDMATRRCFVDRSNVDRSIPGGRSSNWDGLRSLLRRPGGLSGRPGGLGSLPGRPGRHF